MIALFISNPGENVSSNHPSQGFKKKWFSFAHFSGTDLTGRLGRVPFSLKLTAAFMKKINWRNSFLGRY
jgi:hypothetical protein